MIKILRIACAVALAGVGLSAVAEPKGPEYAVVTCAEDGTGLGGGKITLRDAVLAMADPAFTNATGARVITFAPDMDFAVKLTSSLVIGEGTLPFAIDGGANDWCVTITSTGCRLIEHKGHGLTLRNLQLEGGATAAAGGAIYASGPASVTNQTLTVSNCLFSANAAQDGGAIAAESNTVTLVQCCTFDENVATNAAGAVRTAGRLTTVNSTFYGNRTSRSGASALAVTAGGELLVAKCTILAGVGTGGGLYVASGAKATVCDSLLLGNVASETMTDVVNDGSLALYGTGLSSAPTGGGTTVRPKEDNDFNVGPESLFSSRIDPVAVVHGVTNAAFTVAYCAASTNGAGVLWSDAVWTNVAVGSATAPVTALCGSKDLATIRLVDDQTGAEDRPARGALRHGFVNRMTFVVAGQSDRVVEADCGSTEVPNAPAVQCVGGVIKGWFSEPDGRGTHLWDEKGNPDPTNLPKVPYEPLVAYADVEQSDAAYTVNDGGDGTFDDGRVTLRMLVEAMAAHPEWKGSAGRRVITIPASVGTVNLADTLEVSNVVPFVIRGAWDGTNAVTIKAQGSGYRLFHLKNDGMGFENLTFRGAMADGSGGGAILSESGCALTVSNCAFRANRAYGSGGAVRLKGAGTFLRCSFDGNTALLDNGHGGAVSAESFDPLVFRNCSFSRNVAEGSNASGGSVYCLTPGGSVFENCTFFDNRATSEGAVQFGIGESPTITGCLAVSNSPSSSAAALTNLLVAALAEGGDVKEAVFGGANHAYVRPVPCEAITNAPGAAATLDLLGRAALVQGLGAVRSEYGIRLDLDPGAGGRVLDDIQSIWGQCGRPCDGLIAPSAQRDGVFFLGWWTEANRAGEQVFDAEGRPLGGVVLPLAEKMTLYAGWKTKLEGLEVTTADDTTGAGDAVSLRDAIRKIVENAADIGEDDMPTVTFRLPESAVISLATPLEIPANVPPFAIDGTNEGAAVTLAASAAGLAALVKANGRGLVLRNLMFAGAPCTEATVVSANGALAVENCAFAVSGCPLSAANVQTLVSGCSFSEATGPLVCHGRTNTLVNVAHFGTAAGAVVDCTGDSLVLQGTFAKADACAGFSAAVNNLCGEQHLAGTNFLTRVGGVIQQWRPALFGEAATDGARRICHDAFWANVACEQAGGGMVALRGTVDLATLALETDLLGQTDVRLAKGAVRSRFALRYDLDANGGTVEPTNAVAFCGETPGAMPVPTRELHDFAGWYSSTGTKLFDAKGNPCDGVTAPWQESIRLVAGWAAKPELLIVRNETEFRAAFAALTNSANIFADRTITMKGNISLGGGLIVEPTVKPFAIDGQGFALTGGDGSTSLIEHRGMGLALRNLTLREIKSPSPGGVVRADGPFRAENCRFEGNSAPSGGALCLENATNVVVDCTFVRNTATADGGAVCVKSGASVIVHCTFVDNRAETSGDAVCVSGSARLGLLACSFVGSAESGGVKGLVQASGTSAVTAAGCVFANLKAGAGEEVSFSSGVQAVVECCTFTKMSVPSSWNKCFVAPLGEVFLDNGRVKSRKTGFVTHECVQPALTKQMAGGVWVWHDADWANVAYGFEPNRDVGLQEVLGNPDACPLRKSTDQVGMEFSSRLIFRGAVAALAANEIGLEVTTAEDVDDPTDGKISLREAIRSAASGELDPGPDGRFTITFADSLFAATNQVTVKLACTNEFGMIQPAADIVIQGRTDGRSIALAARNNQNAPVFRIDSDRRFALRNLTIGFVCTVVTNGFVDAGFVHAYGEMEIADCLFEGCHQAWDAPMVWTGDGGVSTIERCSFVGSGQTPEKLMVDGGIVRIRSGRSMRIIDCTFANLNLTDSNGKSPWSPVEAQSSGRETHLAVVNCTFIGNKTSVHGYGGGVCIDGRDTYACVLNCIFNNNKCGADALRDVFVDNGASIRVLGCVYSGMVKKSGSTTLSLTYPEIDDKKCVRQTSADQIFSGPLRRISVGGVLRAYRPPRLFGPADRHGCYVWHDAAWTNVAISTRYVNTTDKTNVVGAVKNKGLATTLAGRYDVTGRDALEGINPRLGMAKDRQATMGSYTTPLDGETGECGELVVTDPTDDGKTESEHDAYDGKLSLREAVDFANAHPYWRDTNGNCRVTFGGDAFTNVNVRTIKSQMRQMEVTGFTNGTLSVVGPESGFAVMLDGGGVHRLFYVAPDNGLSLQNLNFTNAVSQKAGACQTFAGGAINSKGRLEVRNCSFRDCRTFQNTGALWGAVSGRAYGGAVCTETGGSTVIEQCTFLGCQAMNGGAVCTDAGGETVLAASVFADNAAFDDGGAGLGCGGAVCALDGAGRMVLVNCTLTRNLAQRRGGAIAAGQTRDALGRLTPSLYLLDSIVLGNGATEDADSADIRLEGMAKVARCWLGRRNAGTLDGQWGDGAAVLTGKVPADIFARFTKDGGVALASESVSRGAWHAFFPLCLEVDAQAAFVWTYNGWANVGYSPDKNGMSQQSVLYARERGEILLKTRGVPMTSHQLGTAGQDRALMGATAEYVSRGAPVPDENVDPLRVTNGTFRAFCDVLDYAATHTGDPSLVSNGCLTVTFAEPYVIDVTSNLVLSAFTSSKLRIVGPVTFTGKLGSDPAFRPFLVTEGNSLVLESVNFADCLATDGFGGAICLEGAELAASNVTFSACKAYSADDGIGFGGAVAALDGSTAVFTACTFTGNQAPDGDGQAVYRYESTATFADCTFAGFVDERLQTEVVDWLNALLIKPDKRKTYFSTVAEALAQCHRGDTLVLLNPDGPDVELVREKLPTGVTLKVYADENVEEALEFVQTMADDANAAFVSKSEPWYTATVRETDGLVVMSVGLNDQAKPGIGEVDFNAADGTVVSVWPTDVKPGLVYGLGRSESPAGPFVVEEDGWVQADANRTLPRALTAPKGDGAGYFYRVIVRD